MNTRYRRFEILLPLRFNDGAAVPDTLIAETILELRQKFGAVSAESQTIHGQWQHQGEIYRDELARLFLDVEDTPDNHRFFIELKDRLKKRFHQLDVWVISHSIDVL